MTRILPGAIAMAIIVVASNILVQFQLGNWLTWGALTYPFAFLVTDVTNRVQGSVVARKIVLAGFVAGVACSVIAAFAGMTTLRIAVASGLAFLVSQLIDIAVFDRLRMQKWWRAPLISSVVGSALDTLMFFSIAFAVFLPADANTGWSNEVLPLLGIGPDAPLWVSLGGADWGVKMALALVALAPFRIITRRILGLRPAF